MEHWILEYPILYGFWGTTGTKTDGRHEKPWGAVTRAGR